MLLFDQTKRVLFGIALETSSIFVYADCSRSLDSALFASEEAKKAYRADDLDSCQSHSKKAYRLLLDSEAHGSYCRCRDAADTAGVSALYAKNAYRSDNLEHCQHYAKRAMSNALFVEDYTRRCGR